jgi:hypothetical protein
MPNNYTEIPNSITSVHGYCVAKFGKTVKIGKWGQHIGFLPFFSPFLLPSLALLSVPSPPTAVLPVPH